MSSSKQNDDNYEEEDRRDLAARIIQRNRRTYVARRELRALIKSNYVKIHDRKTNQVLYKNKTTLVISLEKPLGLGSSDLLTPRYLEAPEDYYPGDRPDNIDGYAIIITCTKFTNCNDKIPSLPHAYANDHRVIEDILTNDLITRLPAENVTSVTDPTNEDFLNAFQNVRKVATKNSFLVVYICTHALQIIINDRKDKRNKEDCYFATANTVWTLPKAIADTSVSLTSLAMVLNKIPCLMKTVFLNCIHSENKARSMFSKKSLYPTHSIYTRLADSAGCVVVASCSIGNHLSDLLQYTPFSKASCDGSSSSSSNISTVGGSSKDGSAVAIGLDDDSVFTMLASPTEYSNTNSGYTNDPMYNPKDAIMEQHLIDFNMIERSSDSSGNTDFQPPLPTWRNDDSTGYKFQITLPTDAEIDRYNMRVRQAQFKSYVGRPLKYIRDRYRRYRQTVASAPYQVGLIDSKLNHSYFGHAFIAAITAASVPDNPFITVKMLFIHMYDKFKAINSRNSSRSSSSSSSSSSSNKKRNANSSSGSKAASGSKDIDSSNSSTNVNDENKDSNESVGVEADDGVGGAALAAAAAADVDTLSTSVIDPAASDTPTMKVDANSNRIQTPLLLIPVKYQHIRSVTESIYVSYRCGQPATPEKPYIKKVGFNEVTLHWQNPPFDGIQPTQYEIYMRNESRLYSNWTRIPYKGLILQTKFTIKDLPSGISCQFKVRSKSIGGWSAFSPNTMMITPGEEQQPIQSFHRWKKVSLGGVFTILDRLSSYPHHRHEYVIGLRKLLSIGQDGRGFKKGAQLKVAQATIHALLTFPLDVDIATVAFQLLAYALQGKALKQVRVYILQNNITVLTDEYLVFFRNNTSVISSLSYLRSLLPDNSINLPSPVALKKMKKDGDSSDSDVDEAVVEEVDDAKDAALNLLIL